MIQICGSIHNRLQTLASITGASFEQQHPKANPCPVLVVSAFCHYRFAHPVARSQEESEEDETLRAT